MLTFILIKVAEVILGLFASFVLINFLLMPFEVEHTKFSERVEAYVATITATIVVALVGFGASVIGITKYTQDIGWAFVAACSFSGTILMSRCIRSMFAEDNKHWERK